jgi:hypothetical protein
LFALQVIDVAALRKQYVEDYKAGKVTRATHPVMRQWDDPACDRNPRIELAKVAAVSCHHGCIQTVCGGDPHNDSRGCRFDMPKKPMRATVVAVMPVNSEQMEARIILRRTATRVPNLNEYFLKYLRR